MKVLKQATLILCALAFLSVLLLSQNAKGLPQSYKNKQSNLYQNEIEQKKQEIREKRKQLNKELEIQDERAVEPVKLSALEKEIEEFESNKDYLRSDKASEIKRLVDRLNKDLIKKYKSHQKRFEGARKRLVDAEIHEEAARRGFKTAEQIHKNKNTKADKALVAFNEAKQEYEKGQKRKEKALAHYNKIVKQLNEHREKMQQEKESIKKIHEVLRQYFDVQDQKPQVKKVDAQKHRQKKFIEESLFFLGNNKQTDKWIDDSPHQEHAKIHGNVPIESGGYFTRTNQINDWIELPVNVLQDRLSQGNVFTIIVVAHFDKIPKNGNGQFMLSVSAQNNYNLYLPVQIRNGVINPYNAKGKGRIEFKHQEPVHLTIVQNGDTLRLYKNAAEQVANYRKSANLKRAKGWTLNQEQDKVLGGFAASQAVQANFLHVSMYDYAFTNNDIQEHYNMIKTMYGDALNQ